MQKIELQIASMFEEANVKFTTAKYAELLKWISALPITVTSVYTIVTYENTKPYLGKSAYGMLFVTRGRMNVYIIAI